MFCLCCKLFVLLYAVFVLLYAVFVLLYAVFALSSFPDARGLCGSTLNLVVAPQYNGNKGYSDSSDPV